MNKRNCIPARNCLGITSLCGRRLFAISTEPRFLSWKFYLAKDIEAVCDAFCITLIPVYLYPPSLKKEWKQISSEFLELWMSHVIGVICRKYVVMECLLYYKYKGFFFQVLLVVACAKN